MTGIRISRFSLPIPPAPSLLKPTTLHDTFVDHWHGIVIGVKHGIFVDEMLLYYRLFVCVIVRQADQVVPDWLEHAAEEAVGSSYGPAGGKFASKDRREVTKL